MRHLSQIIALTLMLSDINAAEPEFIATRVSLDQATHEIISESQSRVLGAHTEIIDGREVHVIKVLTADGHIRHYRIDAETGELIN
jgi:uncharacterized membrane protein YkoI